MPTVAEAHGLTPAQLDALEHRARGPAAEVVAQLGSRGRGLHPSPHPDTALVRGRRAGLAVLGLPPAVLAGRRRRAFPLEDSRQHGDRPQRPPRPVRLDEGPGAVLHRRSNGIRRARPRDGSTTTTTCTTPSPTSPRRTGTSGTASSGSAGRQPWSPANLGNPLYALGLALIFDHGIMLHDVDLGHVREGKKSWAEAKLSLKNGLRKSGKLAFRDYIMWPAFTGPLFFSTLAANAAGQRGAQHLGLHHHLLRPLPERGAGVHRRGVRGGVQGSLVLPPDARVGQHHAAAACSTSCAGT